MLRFILLGNDQALAIHNPLMRVEGQKTTDCARNQLEKSKKSAPRAGIRRSTKLNPINKSAIASSKN